VRVYGWEPCEVGCGNGCCYEPLQICVCDENYEGTNCEYIASGKSMNLPSIYFQKIEKEIKNRKSKIENRKSKIENRKSKIEKRKAKSEKRKAKSEKRKAKIIRT
jgi:hypothetical protein